MHNILFAASGDAGPRKEHDGTPNPPFLSIVRYQFFLLPKKYTLCCQIIYRVIPTIKSVSNHVQFMINIFYFPTRFPIYVYADGTLTVYAGYPTLNKKTRTIFLLTILLFKKYQVKKRYPKGKAYRHIKYFDEI